MKLLNILIYHPDFNDLDKKNEMNEKKTGVVIRYLYWEQKNKN